MTSVGADQAIDHQPGDQRSARLKLLQGFTLHRGTDLVAVPMIVARLVAFLAIRRRPQHRSVVASTLWIDSPEARAAANLRSALWRAQRSCAGLVANDRGFLAVGDTVTCDLHDAVDRAHRLMSENGAVDPDAVLNGVIGDLAEDLLPTWSDDWVLIERERVRQLRLHALDALSRAMSGQNRFGLAVEAAQAAVAAEPLRESAQRTLIEVHLAEHNVAEAVRVYRSYVTLLDDQLGIAPTADLSRDLPMTALAN